jgi:hypothetical protein
LQICGPAIDVPTAAVRIYLGPYSVRTDELTDLKRLKMAGNQLFIQTYRMHNENLLGLIFIEFITFLIVFNKCAPASYTCNLVVIFSTGSRM